MLHPHHIRDIAFHIEVCHAMALSFDKTGCSPERSRADNAGHTNDKRIPFPVNKTTEGEIINYKITQLQTSVPLAINQSDTL